MRHGSIIILMMSTFFFCSKSFSSQKNLNNQVLPKSHFVLKSTLEVNLTNHSVKLPIHLGQFKDKHYWYILTDVSDKALADKLGLNFAPKLANAGRDCPSCVQVLDLPEDITEEDCVMFKGVPDFSPMRKLVAGPAHFPPVTTVPGSVAGELYSPYIQVAGTNIVYNASIIASGDGPFDVKKHTNTHDRVLKINIKKKTVDLLAIRAFSGGKEVVYVGLESSSAEAAVFERSTFTPGLALISFPNGAFRKDGARAGLFAFANGQLGTESPPAQGLNHLIKDGLNAQDADISNRALINALRNGGDARNVIEVFPTMTDPMFSLEYSPAWDLHLTVWNQAAVSSGENVAQTDAFTVRTLAENWTVGSPGGFKLASSGIEVNCPVVAFVDEAPLAPLVPAPVVLPLQNHQ